jgi:putative addiction module CopG family antidote
MRTTKAISITLPREMVRMIKTKVASGEYASDSEVVRDGLRTLQARDVALEKFLREEAAKSYDEYKIDPKNVVSIADVSAGLDARHRARRAKSRKK